MLLLNRDSNADIHDAEKVDEDLSSGGSGAHILCAACGARVARAGDRIAVNGNHCHSFFNPAGLVFELGCFAAAHGCLPAGNASLEFTWFPGYSWQVALCAACTSHLGWHYASAQGGGFFGLILSRIVEEREDDPA